MRRRDDGLTLVELMMSISILGLIMSVLAGAVFVGVRAVDFTSSSVTDTHGRLMGSMTFAQDVADATTVTTSAGTTACDGSTVASVPVRLSWTDTDVAGTATTYTVDYVVTTVGGERQLVRYGCSSAAPVAQLTIAHAIVGATVGCTGVVVNGTTVPNGQCILSVTDSAGALYTVSGRRRAP